MRCSFGQRWHANVGCKGKPKGVIFIAAQKIAKGDWRLPTSKELETLIVPSSNGVAKIDVNAFPIMHNQKMLYWSSEQVDESSAWYADFENGVIDHYFGDYDFLKEKFLVRFVKDRP